MDWRTNAPKREKSEDDEHSEDASLIAEVYNEVGGKKDARQLEETTDEFPQVVKIEPWSPPPPNQGYLITEGQTGPDPPNSLDISPSHKDRGPMSLANLPEMSPTGNRKGQMRPPGKSLDMCPPQLFQSTLTTKPLELGPSTEKQKLDIKMSTSKTPPSSSNSQPSGSDGQQMLSGAKVGFQLAHGINEDETNIRKAKKTSCSNLSIDDFNRVAIACRSISHAWEDLAKYLDIHRNTVLSIQKENGGGSTTGCLDKLLTTWLCQPPPNQPKPSWSLLCDAVSKIDRPLSEKIWTDHTRECRLCHPVRYMVPRNTVVAMGVQQGNTIAAAKELKNDFKELMNFLIIEISKINVDQLRYKISEYFEEEEGTINDELDKHLLKIEDCDSPCAILNYFRRHRFIGYVNYSLIKVFQGIAAKNPLLDKRIEEYEKDYQCFLELSLSQIHDAFQQCPDLRSDYPAGIPKFKIHLESEWEGESMLNLKEFLKHHLKNRGCVDQLMIAKISRNCIIITFAVLPHIARKILGYLTNDDVIMTMKKEGISVDISKELMKYSKEMETTTSMEKTFGALDETEPSHGLHTYTTGMQGTKRDHDTSFADDSSEFDDGDSETTSKYSKLVELEEDATVQEAVDTYETVIMLQERNKSLETQLVTHKHMMMELDTIKKVESVVKKVQDQSIQFNYMTENASDVSVQTADSDDDVDLSYTGFLYYSRDGDGTTINHWLVRFIAVSNNNLDVLETNLKNQHPNAVADECIRFGFHGNNGVLELVMNHVQDTHINGWTVQPHKNPLTIRQKHMDMFGRDDGVPFPPSCLVTVYATPGPDTAPDLHYCVPLRGVVCDTEEIFINRILEKTSEILQDNTMPELSQGEHGKDHIKHEETISDHSDDNEGNVKAIMNRQLHQENDMLRQQNDKLKLEKEELRQELEIVKRESVVKKVQDQSTQFNYMTTVNDCLDSVHVGGETVYFIQGNDAQSFNWSKWGLRIHFPEDSVRETSTDTMMTEVAVEALVGGEFQFPDGSELVSAVYAVSFANNLLKPVKLEMQHCAVLKNKHQYRRLSFVKAPMRQRVPPFEFSPLEGGVFNTDSQYGSITLPDHFFLIAIVLEVNNIPVGVDWRPLPIIAGNDDFAVTHSNDDDVYLSYAGQFYYSRHGMTINQWLVRFLAIKNLDALKTYLKKELPHAATDPAIQFGFHGNNGVLELVMNHVQDTPINGWTVRPHTNPLTIRQKLMDKFGRDDGVPSPPSCLVTVYATPGLDTASDLHYCVPLRGVVCDIKEMFINRILDEIPHERSEPYSHITSDQGSRQSNEVTDTAVNYCEVFKNHYDDLITAMVTSCSLSNVARGLKSVNLVCQGNVDDAVNATRPQEIEQSVIKLLREVQNFLNIAKRHPSKQKKMLVDFCKVLQDQDSPMLLFISTEILEILGGN